MSRCTLLQHNNWLSRSRVFEHNSCEFMSLSLWWALLKRKQIALECDQTSIMGNPSKKSFFYCKMPHCHRSMSKIIHEVDAIVLRHPAHRQRPQRHPISWIALTMSLSASFFVSAFSPSLACLKARTQKIITFGANDQSWDAFGANRWKFKDFKVFLLRRKIQMFLRIEKKEERILKNWRFKS